MNGPTNEEIKKALGVLEMFIMGAANEVTIHENAANRVVIKAREGFPGSYREREATVERGLGRALVAWAKQNPPLGQEKIVAAAIKTGDGTVWSLPQPARHCDVIKHIWANDGPRDTGPERQGFLTDAGRFVDRREGERVARACKQILRGKLIGSVLTSEDLW